MVWSLNKEEEELIKYLKIVFIVKIFIIDINRENELLDTISFLKSPQKFHKINFIF